MKRPNFLVIGAAKSGTTSLYAYINQHPDVYFSQPKGPWFFDTKEYEKGLEFYWSKYYKGWSGQKAIGEATPNYLPVPFVPERIKKSVPEAKLIAILRNPIDRSYAGWWMHYRHGREKLSFEDAIRENLKRIEAGMTLEGKEGKHRWYEYISNIDCYEKGISKYRTYLGHGYYSQQLKRYMALFPKSQLMVIFFEDLCHDPQKVVQDIWNFIGVDPKRSLKDTTPRNVAFANKKVFLLARKLASTKLHKILPEKTRAQLAGHLARIGSRPEMGKEIRAWLVGHYYQHNRELEKLTGRNLSHWDK